MGILRSTFVIDKSGKITHVFEKVSVKTHALDILKALQG
jgi:peroxiredoxin Q/BCP